jgi:hypothetical protein
MLATTPAISAPTAADKDTARALMKEGRSRRTKGDHRGALESFVAADALMNVPTTGLEVGRTQVQLGLLVEARDTFLRVSRTPEEAGEPPAFKEARSEAAAGAIKLEERVPTLKVSLTGVPAGATASITIDGVNIPSAAISARRKLNPGTHEIVAIVAGGAKQTTTVELAEGDAKDITVDLSGPVTASPAPAAVATKTDPSPETPRATGTSSLTYVGFAVAGVGIAVGSVTGLIALSKKNAAEEGCAGSRCPPSTHDELTRADTMATVSTIAFVAGAVGVGVGIYGLIRGPAAPAANTSLGPLRRVEPYVGVGGFGVVGAF